MNNFEKIDHIGSLFLTAINEPEDNSLFLEIKKSLITGTKEDLIIGGSILKDVQKIQIDEQSDYFTILFESYVSYHVIAESFSNFNERKVEPIDGKGSFCVYSHSTYLDFIAQETYAKAVLPSDLKHYCLYCQNHIVHVISTKAPIIENVNSRHKKPLI